MYSLYGEGYYMKGIELIAAAWVSDVLVVLSCVLVSRRRLCSVLLARSLEKKSSSSSAMWTLPRSSVGTF
jgi:hypothetical protein